jgi:CheY-like chemotaxis protein
MIGNLAMLEDRLTDQDLHKRFVEPASQAAGRAAHLTRQLLAYAGRDTNVAETLDLETEVRELSGLLSTAVSRRITLRYDVASGPFHVHSDRGQFQQVMMNLVINAAESYLDRGGEVRIGIRQEELDGTDRFLNVTRLNAGPYVRLTVEDDGCGMKPELLEEMFDPFFSTKHAGRGLGLSAVVAVLNANDAGITVRSHVGLGTRFDVLWPERIVAGPGQSSPVRQPYTVAGQVLVVDDEPAIGELAREVLAGDGHQTTVVQDGDEALALLRDPTGHFDVILLDLMMPGTDGFAVLDALIDEQPDLPVVLTSGYDPRKEAEARFNRALELQFPRKPSPPHELRAAVSAALGEAVSPVSGSTVHG